MNTMTPGGLIQYKDVILPVYIGNPIVEIRRSYDRLISTMGFPKLVRWHLYIESGSCCSGSLWHKASSIHHDDVIKWKHFPRNRPFVRGDSPVPVNSPHKGQWRGALMFSLIYVWINGWVNNREAGDLRPHRAHYDVIVMMVITLLDNSFRPSDAYMRQ